MHPVRLKLLKKRVANNAYHSFFVQHRCKELQTKSQEDEVEFRCRATTMILTRTASLSASAEELRRFSTPTLHRCVTVEERSSAPTPRCVTETTILGSQEPPKPKKLVKTVSRPKAKPVCVTETTCTILGSQEPPKPKKLVKKVSTATEKPVCVTETILGSQEPPKPKKLVKKVSKPKKLDKVSTARETPVHHPKALLPKFWPGNRKKSMNKAKTLAKKRKVMLVHIPEPEPMNLRGKTNKYDVLTRKLERLRVHRDEVVAKNGWGHPLIQKLNMRVQTLIREMSKLNTPEPVPAGDLI